MKSSAILDTAGVRDIGRSWFLISVTGFSFGIGTTSAFFQSAGRRCLAKLLFKIDGKGYRHNLLRANLGCRQNQWLCWQKGVLMHSGRMTRLRVLVALHCLPGYTLGL